MWVKNTFSLKGAPLPTVASPPPPPLLPVCCSNNNTHTQARWDVEVEKWMKVGGKKGAFCTATRVHTVCVIKNRWFEEITFLCGRSWQFLNHLYASATSNISKHMPLCRDHLIFFWWWMIVSRYIFTHAHKHTLFDIFSIILMSCHLSTFENVVFTVTDLYADDWRNDAMHLHTYGHAAEFFCLPAVHCISNELHLNLWRFQSF